MKDKIKLTSLFIGAITSTTAVLSILSSSPAEAFRKPWTQVLVGELTDYQFRTGCFSEVCLGNKSPDNLCKKISGNSWAFYRYDEGKHRCWVRAFR